MLQLTIKLWYIVAFLVIYGTAWALGSALALITLGGVLCAG